MIGWLRILVGVSAALALGPLAQPIAQSARPLGEPVGGPAAQPGSIGEPTPIDVDQDIEIPLGSTYSFTVSKPSMATFAVSPMPLPAHAAFDSLSGEFEFTPEENQVGSTFEIEVKVVYGAGQAVSTFRSLTVTALPKQSPTSVSGLILDSETKQPISGVSVAIGEVSVVTGPYGAFLLDDIDLDAATLLANGFEAEDGPYAFVAEPLALLLKHELYEGQDNVIDRPIYLPFLGEPAGSVDPESDTVLYFDSSMGPVELEVFAGSAVKDDELFDGEVYLVEVASESTPAALPEALVPSLVLAIQPAGISFDPPARLLAPNTDGFPEDPDNIFDLWSIDPEVGEFKVAGTGKVVGDAIDTEDGGVSAASWHFFLPPDSLPGEDRNNPGNQDLDDAPSCPFGSEAVIATGNLVVDHALTTYRSMEESRGLRLVYNSTLADPRPILTADSAIPVQSTVPATVSTSLTVGGVDLGLEVFTDTSGFSESQDEPFVTAVQFDATSLATGCYPYVLEQTSNFGTSAVTSFRPGDVLVHNLRNSAIGAGWGIAGLLQLVDGPAGRVVVADGGGAIRTYLPASGAGFALTLDGSNDYAEIPSNLKGMGITTAFTVSAWIKATSAGGMRMLLEDGTQFNTDAFYLGVTPSTNRIFARLNTVNGSVFSDNISVPSFAGKWTHLALTYDGATFTAYFNGAPVYQPSISGQIANGNRNLRIGFPSGESYYAGDIDELRIWNTAMSASDLAASMALPLVGNEDGLVGYWRFDDGSGQLMSDASGNGLDGTLGSLPGADGNDPTWQPSMAPLACQTAACDYTSPPGDFSTLSRLADSTYLIEDPTGRRYSFDAAGRLTTVVDVDMNTTTYGYDALGRLQTVVDPVGAVTTLSYGDEFVSSIIDPTGRATVFEHDESGDLVSITDPDQTTRTFAYDPERRMVGQTTRTGAFTQYTYDHAGRLSVSSLPDGSNRSMVAAEVVPVIDTSMGVGSAASPAPVVRPDDVKATYLNGKGGAYVFQVASTWDITSMTDPLGRTATVERDADGLALIYTSPGGDNVTMAYDEFGRPVTLTREGNDGPSSNDLTTSFSWDPQNGLPTGVVAPLGNINPMTGQTLAMAYESGNLVEFIDVNDVTTTFSYDSLEAPALPTIITLAAGSANEAALLYDYDMALFNLRSTTNADHATVLFERDAAGNVATFTDADGHVSRYEYDELNRLVKIAGAPNPDLTAPCGSPGITCMAYDPAGRLVTLTDDLGAVTCFGYNDMGQLASRTDPLGRTETLEYDANGNLMRYTQRNGQVIEYDHDAADRLVTKTWKQALGEIVTAYAYDDDDRIVSIASDDSALTFDYDALGRLTRTSTAGSPFQPRVTLEYSYDANGNRTSVSTPSGSTTYTYDAADRLETLDGPEGAFSFAYDDLSRLTTQQAPNGVITYRVYGPTGRLDALDHVGATAIASYDYGYDATGNRTSVIQSRLGVAVPAVVSYDYDERHQLTAATGPLQGDDLESFSYDPLGNRLLQAGQVEQSVFDLASRLLEDEDYCYGYDDNGNLVVRTAKSAGRCSEGNETVEYYYNPENRLIEVAVDGVTLATYRYDVLGRRIGKNVGGQESRYIHDGDALFLEYDGANSLQARYIHGLGVDEPLAYQRAGERFYYHADGLGSVSDITDVTGDLVDSLAYSSFGKVASGGAVSNQPFGFTSRLYDAETGLHEYRARTYDASLGRFLQEDPMWINGGINRFTYVQNNPANRRDPFGLLSFSDLDDGFPNPMRDFDFNIPKNINRLLGKVAKVLGKAASIVGLINRLTGGAIFPTEIGPGDELPPMCEEPPMCLIEPEAPDGIFTPPPMCVENGFGVDTYTNDCDLFVGDG